MAVIKLAPLLSVVLVILLVFTYQFIILDKFYPLTFAGSENISFLTKQQAVAKIENAFQKRAHQKIYFNFPQDIFSIDLATSSASLDYSALEETLNNQRSGTFLERTLKQINIALLTKKITLKVNLKIEKQLEAIKAKVEKEPKNAELLFSETASEGSPSANIQIKEAVDGLSLDRETLEKSISDYLISGKYNMNLPVKITPPKVTTEHVQKAKAALENLQKESIKLKFEGSLWVLDTKTLLTLLDLTTGENLLLDKEKTKSYISKIAKDIDQNVQEGLFEFNPNTKRVSTFKASQEGRKLDQDKTSNLIAEALDSSSSKTLILPVEIVKPKIQTSDVNSLGINELIGQGVSHFRGSIPNRIYNVNLTATKINGVLIPPEEIFSFNQTVGDITAATGFKQAYVIKEGRTVLDDGGGVCQDSTTLFRAVLNAGLPVIKRTAHAYRVGYYEQGFPPGLDATVYYPSVDFQFKNDTPGHILIQAYTSGTTLYVDLYGTSDGRIATISKSIITDRTPAPPELRQDDPTLPKGVVKQVDFAAAGAKVSFNRTVTRNGEVIGKEVWRSLYKPWQAVYLVGTQ